MEFEIGNKTRGKVSDREEEQQCLMNEVSVMYSIHLYLLWWRRNSFQCSWGWAGRSLIIRGWYAKNVRYTIYNTCWYCNHSTLPVAVEEKCCPVFLQ